MGFVKRALLVVVTIGWLVPLCASFWAIYRFIWDVVWPTAAFGKQYQASWHPFSVADYLFYFSMAWLALVLTGWAIFLTRRT